MAKYLQLFENADALNALVSRADGQPWVGAEVATKTVRYEKTGIIVAEPMPPQIIG
jgi:hypothetical protein